MLSSERLLHQNFMLPPIKLLSLNQIFHIGWKMESLNFTTLTKHVEKKRRTHKWQFPVYDIWVMIL